MLPHPRYQPVEKIASGSFATVYRGKDLELGREVAIKQIHEQFLSDPKQLERYWAEAQLLASFQHPNIVTIYDLVRDRGWLIMELMQSDLSKVAGRRPMDVNGLRTTIAHALRALKFLHSHGIVHGDIKPSNMMIDRRRRVKIGDFGLARRVSDEEGSLIKGTTKYMAPEVLSDEFGEVGPASDLYSLGFAAYELLAGENFQELFPGLDSYGRDRQLAWMMWQAAPDRRLPEIGRVLRDVPEDLAKTIQKLVNKHQSNRYQNADQALADLNIDIKAAKSGEESSATLTRPEKTAENATDKKRRMLLIGAFAVSAVMSLSMLFLPFGGEKQNSPASTADDRTGIVQTVKREAMSLELLQPNGSVVLVALGKEPVIRSEDGEREYLSISDIKSGDRIGVVFRTDNGETRARVAVRRPIESTGRIKLVDADRRVFRVSVDADPRPEDVDMSIPKSAKLLLNAKPTEISEFSPGDRVAVTHIVSESPDTPRTIITLDGLRTLHATGFVAEVISENDQEFLRFDRWGKVENLPIAEKCAVKITNIDASSESLTPADLKTDDRIEIEYDTKVTAVTATRRDRISGVVMAIDLGARELLVRDNNGKEHTLAIPANCPLTIDGNEGVLDDLKKFYKLEITLDTKSKTIYTVDSRRNQ